MADRTLKELLDDLLKEGNGLINEKRRASMVYGNPLEEEISIRKTEKVDLFLKKPKNCTNSSEYGSKFARNWFTNN